MSLPTKPKKAQKPWIDLGIFAAVFAFVGFSVHMLLGFVSRDDGRLTKTTLSMKETLPLDPEAVRKPSSPSPARHEGASTEVLRLPCLNQAAQKHASQARQLQIYARACEDDLKFPNGWIGHNETSGEEIVVFVNAKEKTFSTSYFSLQKGINRIVFTQHKTKSRDDRRVVMLEISK